MPRHQLTPTMAAIWTQWPAHPQPAVLDELLAVAGQDLAPLPASERLDLLVAAASALDAITHGAGTQAHAGHLSLIANIAALLAEYGLGAEYLAELQTVQAEVACLVDRGQRLGRWALSGPGIQAVQALISIHAAQLQSDDCTHHLRTTVLREMRRRMQEGHTINAQPVGLRGSLT